MPKDIEKAREWLQEYLDVLNELHQPHTVGLFDEQMSWIRQHEARVMKVIGDLVPGMAWYQAGGASHWVSDQRAAIERTLGVLEHQKDVDQYWSSDSVIEIDADALHPWVWEAAKGLWSTEWWGEAVEAAVKVLNAKLQQKLGRNDISGAPLVTEAFSPDPPKQGGVRLRVVPDDGGLTYKSIQQGAMYLGLAVMMLWRNPLSHVPGGSARHLALEGLAAASTFARLVENSTVVTD